MWCSIPNFMHRRRVSMRFSACSLASRDRLANGCPPVFIAVLWNAELEWFFSAMLRLLREPKAGYSLFWTVRLLSLRVIVSSYATHLRSGQSEEGGWLIFVPPRGSAARPSG